MSIIREYGVYMYIYVHIYTHIHMGFPGGSDCKEFNYSVEDLGSVPGWEDPLEEGMATHSSILAWRIPMDRGAWQAAVHGVAESDMTERLSKAHMHMCVCIFIDR